MNLRTLLPVLVLTTLVLLGCSTTPDVPAQVATPDIEPIVVPTGPPLMPTSTPAPTPTPTSKLTPVPPVLDQACTLGGGEVVKSGWSGKDTGGNYCNQCFCMNGALGCTRMACEIKEITASAPTATPTTKSGEAEIAARIRLSVTLGITERALAVYSIESLDWSDASLGCPKTGYSYAQVITPGYRIIFDVKGVHYRVHTNLDGSVTVLCSGTTPPTSTPVPTQSVNTDPFWNKPMHPVTHKCTGSFQFTHKLVDVADVDAIGVSPGGHIAPHDHMAYWATADIEDQPHKSDDEKQSSEKVQLYSPADIFFISLGKNHRKELGGTLFTCDGHGVLIGHVSDPSDELNLILAENAPEPGCDDNSCRWRFPTFIPAGTPLFKSSGYTSGFDFGLMLVGLTAEELQKQPGYGYSITPWRTGGSGNSVCPLEYFEEPLRSEYMKFLGDFRCGPFNQDVRGTAMGFWLDTPSTDTYPGIAFKDEWDVDEWKTLWLFQDFRKTARSSYNMTVGNNTIGLDHGPHGEYSYIASESGLVNRAWDDIKPGKNYCVELRIKENMFVVAEDVHKILILKVSEDGKQLTAEALGNNQCGDGPWIFQGGERTFYR